MKLKAYGVNYIHEIDYDFSPQIQENIVNVYVNVQSNKKKRAENILIILTSDQIKELYNDLKECENTNT